MVVTLAIVLFLIAFCLEAFFGKGGNNSKRMKF